MFNCIFFKCRGTFANRTQKNSSRLGNGICLPASCSSKLVKVFADEMLSKNNLLTTDYDQRVFCNTNNILEMRNIDLLAALFFTFFLLVLIVSTVYDVTMRQMNRMLNNIKLKILRYIYVVNHVLMYFLLVYRKKGTYFLSIFNLQQWFETS